jgi:hypothetical protein
MTEESDFWRSIQAMIREEIANSRRPTGVTPSTRDGNTVDRYGQVVYIEQRRGAGLAGASQFIAPNVSGTVTWGTANVQWNDGTAFWGTAQPTRLTTPVAGRYLVTAYVQAQILSGTADITSLIGVANGMTWVVSDVRRLNGASDVYAAALASIAKMRANDYVYLEIASASVGSSGSVSLSNLNFAIERIG